MDTASKAGPLLVRDVDKGRLPQLVPFVPAPNVEATGLGGEEVADTSEYGREVVVE